MEREVKENYAILRQKAKELIKTRPSKASIMLTEEETIKLIYEMEILQVELELQNDELMQTISSLEKTKESEQTLREYLDNSPNVIHSVNTEGKFTFVSKAWERYFGLPVSAAIGQDYTQFVHSDDLAICHDYVQNILRTGQAGKSLSYRVQVFNGEWRWIVTNGKPYVDSKGNIQFIGVSHDVTDLINTEEALRESEKRYSLSMDATNDGLWDWDIQNDIIYFSPGYSMMLGYNPNEFENKFETWKNLIHPDDLELAISNNMDCLNNISQQINVEYRMKAKDGGWRWILGRGRAVTRDANGIALRMIGTHVDITQRKEDEETLLRKETLLNFTGETANVGGWEFEIDTLKLHWTEEVYRIHELDLTFDLNIGIGASFYASESRPLIENAVNRAIDFGEPFDLELEFITAKGNHKWVHSIGKALLENGRTKKIYGSIQDITRRKQIEEDLRSSESLYRAIINASPYQITITDMKGRITMFSPATLNLFGYEDGKEILGRNFADFLIPEERERAQSVVSLRMQGIITGSNIYVAQRADGSTFHFEVSAEFIYDSKGQPAQLLLIGRDVSNRKKAELEIKQKSEELSKINAEKDKFFSIISHDLRAPFNGFMGFTHILAKDAKALPKKQIQMIASDMNKSATNVFNLLENLLQWARIQQGLIPFVPEVIQLRRMVKQIVELTMHSAISKHIIISNHIQEKTLVFADFQMLKTIISNLIGNAIKFTPKGGRISLSAKACADHTIEVIVKDSGIGISAGIIENLFRIDEKSNRKGTEGESSSGLGLILCKEFVEKHGGKIWVTSDGDSLPDENVGGSTFYFTIPQADLKS